MTHPWDIEEGDILDALLALARCQGEDLDRFLWLPSHPTAANQRWSAQDVAKRAADIIERLEYVIGKLK